MDRTFDLNSGLETEACQAALEIDNMLKGRQSVVMSNRKPSNSRLLDGKRQQAAAVQNMTSERNYELTAASTSSRKARW